MSAKQKVREKLLEMDIHEMDIDQDGVKNFYWPVSYKDRENFCNALIQDYTNLIQEYDQGDNVLSYKFFAKYFITETIAVFNSDLLKGRLFADSYLPLYKKEWRLWSALFQQERPEAPAFINKFQNSPNNKNTKKRFNLIKKTKRVFSLLNIKEKGVGVGNLKLKPLTARVLKENVIATQRTDLIQNHALHTDKDVVFCRSDRWFKEVSNEELKKEQQQAHELFESSILRTVEKLYKEYQLNLDEPSLSYLQDMLSEGTALIRIHYKRLLDQPDQLPRNVWTGTGGNVWDGLLRYASREVYREDSIGHDHGAGLAHVDNPVMAMSEFWGCTEFVCLNKNQAREMSERAPLWYCLEQSLPVISGLAGESQTPVEHKRFLQPDFKIKTIIVLATLYGGDRVWMGPCSPDIVHVDWQARLITQLKAWGYNVILKVHPETPVMPPKTLEELGAFIRSEPLEEMMEEGDLVLFDCLYTSVFRSVVSTNIPMVLIDFYNHPWTEKAQDLVEKRIGFVVGGFDKKNREDVKWDDLKQAIEAAPDKNNNHEFFDYYYA